MCAIIETPDYDECEADLLPSPPPLEDWQSSDNYALLALSQSTGDD